MMIRTFISSLVVAMLANMGSVFAGGFLVPNQGARAAGQADAFTAQADDPSAIYYNPAGLTQLSGTQVTTGIYAVYTGFKFSGPSGDAESNQAGYLPHFYAVSDLGSDRWRVGLGINTVFGLVEDWSSTGPLRANVTHDRLSITSFTPTVAYRLDDHWSIGAGLNVYYGDIELNNHLPFASTEAAFRFKGTDTAFGATVGALWKINDQHSVGVMYRSPFHMDLEGSARLDPPGPAIIGPSRAETRLQLPQTLTIGYAYRPSRQLTLEADVMWAGWRTLDQVQLKSADPRLASLPPVRLQYRDSYTFRLGMQYQLDPAWTVRAGYIYSQTATPNRTFTPMVVDLNSHVFTAGLGYSQPHWSVDLAYRFILGEDRTINHSINSPPGQYHDQTHALFVSVTWKL